MDKRMPIFRKTIKPSGINPVKDLINVKSKYRATKNQTTFDADVLICVIVQFL